MTGPSAPDPCQSKLAWMPAGPVIGTFGRGRNTRGKVNSSEKAPNVQPKVSATGSRPVALSISTWSLNFTVTLPLAIAMPGSASSISPSGAIVSTLSRLFVNATEAATTLPSCTPSWVICPVAWAKRATSIGVGVPAPLVPDMGLAPLAMQLMTAFRRPLRFMSIFSVLALTP
jgi:hypothetical protein